MDLSKWSLLKFSSLTHRCRDFGEFLGQILDGEREVLKSGGSHVKKPARFCVSDDVETLLSQKTEAKIEGVFESFAPYFEAGFLLSQTGDGFAELSSMFVFGLAFRAPLSPLRQTIQKPNRVTLRLPRLKHGEVKTCPAKTVLKHFDLSVISSLNDAQSFIIQPFAEMEMSPSAKLPPSMAKAPLVTTSFIFVCNRARPWQADFVVRSRAVLMRMLDGMRSTTDMKDASTVATSKG